MTQDEIIEMARQAGAELYGHPDYATICVNGKDASDFVKAFAKLAFEKGRQQGMKQERALWELSKSTQEIGL